MRSNKKTKIEDFGRVLSDPFKIQEADESVAILKTKAENYLQNEAPQCRA